MINFNHFVRGPILVFFVLVMSSACTSAPATGPELERDPNAPSRGLMGLDDGPPIDVWRDWTPKSEVHSVPAALGDEATAFDFWRIDDDAFREQAWGAIFTTLGILRQEARGDDTIEEAATLLMASIDPSDSTVELDATFVHGQGTADREGDWEGILIRIWTPVESTTAGASLLLERFADGPESPSQITLWAVTGFEENPGFTARFGSPRTRAALSLSHGLQRTEAPEDTHPLEHAELVWTILEESLWKPLIHSAYLESQIRTGDDTSPAGFEKAAGLELREREIEEMFSGSVFPPRISDTFGR
ncbi:MAG: hypothetical protein ACNA8W_06425 [Bradymonadaceae bacterium]